MTSDNTTKLEKIAQNLNKLNGIHHTSSVYPPPIDSAKNTIIKPDFLKSDQEINLVKSVSHKLKCYASAYMKYPHLTGDKREFAVTKFIEYWDALVQEVAHQLQPHYANRLLHPGEYAVIRNSTEHLAFDGIKRKHDIRELATKLLSVNGVLTPTAEYQEKSSNPYLIQQLITAAAGINKLSNALNTVTEDKRLEPVMSVLMGKKSVTDTVSQLHALCEYEVQEMVLFLDDNFAENNLDARSGEATLYNIYVSLVVNILKNQTRDMLGYASDQWEKGEESQTLINNTGILKDWVKGKTELFAHTLREVVTHKMLLDENDPRIIEPAQTMQTFTKGLQNELSNS